MKDLKLRIIKNKPLLGLLSCLFLATLFIFDHLGARALWLDEAAVAKTIALPFPQIYSQAIMDGHPLFYIYMMKIWSLIWGNSEIALRSLSACMALVLIGFIFKVAKEIFQSPKAGLLASILASTSYFLLWFGTQTRPYTLAAFLGLASFYFFWKITRKSEAPRDYRTARGDSACNTQPARQSALRRERCGIFQKTGLPSRLPSMTDWDEGKISAYIFYLLSTLAGIYTHPWLFLILASQILSLFIFRLKKYPLPFKKILGTMCLILLLIVPNILIITHQSQMGVNAWISKVKIEILGQSFQYLTFGVFWPYLIFAIIAGFYIFFLRELQVSCPRLGEKHLTRDPQLKTIARTSLVLYFLFPLIAAFTVSEFKPAYVAGRYEIIVLPAFLLLLAYFFAQIRSRFLLTILTITLVIFAGRKVVTEQDLIRQYQSTDKTISLSLFNRLRDQDAIIATDLSGATFDYYFSRENQGKKKFSLFYYPAEMGIHPGWKNLKDMLKKEDKYTREAEDLVQQLKTQSVSGRKIWVLYKTDNPLNEILRQKLQANFSLVKIEEPTPPRAPSWLDVILIFEAK